MGKSKQDLRRRQKPKGSSLYKQATTQYGTKDSAATVEKSDYYAYANSTDDEARMWADWYEQQRTTEQPALINEALAALANPERGIFNYKKGKASDFNRRSLQTDLVAAQKFFIDDSLTRHCVEAGLDTPKNLVKMCQNAKPCFDLMWVEWDDWIKIDHMQKLYPKWLGRPTEENENNGIKVGYLIKKLNGKYLCMPVGKMPPNKVAFIGHGFYFDPDEAITLAWSNKMAANGLEDEGDEEAFFRHQFESWIALMGFPWVYKYMPDYFDEDGNLMYTVPDEYPVQTTYKAGFELDYLASRILPAQANFGMMTTDGEWKRGWHPDTMARSLQMNMSTMIGDLRFLITVFAFLNYDHVIYQDSGKPKVKHIRHGRRVPENEFKTVSIDLPKRCVVARRGILTGTGTPKRQHWRRGHPRVYRDANGMVKKRVWIEPQLVGDPANGSIEHDYELRGKKHG